MSKRHLPLSSLLSSHRTVSRKGARLELADLIWFRDQRTTYIVNCSHFRSPPPLSLFYHLPPRLLPLSRFHLVRFICPMHALARLRARIMVKLRKEASTRKLVCPFKRPRVKWTFDCMVYNALNRLARILFIAFYSVEIDIIGGYLNREIGQHCWHVNWQYTMLPPGMEVICVCIYIC